MQDIFKRWIYAQKPWFCESLHQWTCLNYCLYQARVPHVFTILVRTLKMPLNSKATAVYVMRTRASNLEYSYPRMSVLQIVYLGSNCQIEFSRNVSGNFIFSVYKINYMFNISQFRYVIEFLLCYLSPPSSLRSACETCVPNNSIACIIFRSGNDAAFR